MTDILAQRIFTGALFDMDGTLIDSTPAVVRAWTRLAAEFGIPLEATPGSEHGAHGRPAVELLSEVLPAERVPEAVARVTQLEMEDTDGIVALPGAVELLSALPAGRWTIVTSSTRGLAGVRLDAAGIPRPDRIVTFDDVSNGKPHPEPFLTGAAVLGTVASECVAFEDAPAGLAAARAAGCFTVGITGTHTAEELDADVVIDGLSGVEVVAADGGFGIRLA